MINRKKLIALLLGLGISTTSFASWETAFLTSESENGMYSICKYETLLGYRFSIQKQGICYLSVQVDPDTGHWKE